MLAFRTLLLLWSLLQQGLGQTVNGTTTVNATLSGSTTAFSSLSTSSTPTSPSNITTVTTSSNSITTINSSTASANNSSTTNANGSTSTTTTSSTSSSNDTIGDMYPLEGFICVNGSGAFPPQWQQSDGLCCRCEDDIVQCYDISILGCPIAPQDTTGCIATDFCGCKRWVCEGTTPVTYDYFGQSWIKEDPEDSWETVEVLPEDNFEEDGYYSGQEIGDSTFYNDRQGYGDEGLYWDNTVPVYGNPYNAYPWWDRRRRSAPNERIDQGLLLKRQRVAKDVKTAVINDGETATDSVLQVDTKVPSQGEGSKGQAGPQQGANGNIKSMRKTQDGTMTSKDGKNSKEGGANTGRAHKKRHGMRQKNNTQRETGASNGGKEGKPNNGKGVSQNIKVRINRNRNRPLNGKSRYPGQIRNRARIMRFRQNHPRGPNGKIDRNSSKNRGNNKQNQRNKHGKQTKKNKNKKKKKDSKNRKNARQDGKSNDPNQRKKKKNNNLSYGVPTNNEAGLFSGSYDYYGSGDSGDFSYDSPFSFWFNNSFNSNSSYGSNYSDSSFNYDWLNSLYPYDSWFSNYGDNYNYDYNNYNYYDNSQGLLGYWNYPYEDDMGWYYPGGMWNYPNCNCNCGGDKDGDDDDASDEDVDETDVSHFDVTGTTRTPPSTTTGILTTTGITTGILSTTTIGIPSTATTGTTGIPPTNATGR